MPESNSAGNQLAFWKSLARTTFWTLLKRAVIYSAMVAALFLLAAVFINDLGVKTFDASFTVAMLSFGPFYVFMGALCGLTYGVTSALRQKMPEIENGVHMTVNPLVAELVEKIPLGDERIGIAHARSFLQKKIQEISDASTPQFSFFSPIRFLYRFSVRSSLNKLSREFLNKLEEKGEKEITKRAIENYAREKLIGSVVDDLKRQLSFTHYGTLVLSALFLLAPVIVIFVVKS